VSYADMDIELQLVKITAEKGHLSAIREIGVRWQEAGTELGNAGKALQTNSANLNGAWGDANGDYFFERATQSAKVMTDWAAAIASAAPWRLVDAILMEIPQVYQVVSDAAEQIRKLKANNKAGSATGLIAMLQAAAGGRMDGLARLYADAATALQGIKGPPWAGPATAGEAPGGGPGAAPAGAAPTDAAPMEAAGGDPALAGGGAPAGAGAGPAAGGGPAGGGAGSPSLAGGGTPGAVVPPKAVPPSTVPPKPVVPPTSVPAAVRPASNPSGLASSPRGVVRASGVPGVRVAGSPMIPPVAAVPQAAGAPPEPGRQAIAPASANPASASARGNTIGGVPPMAPHAGGGGAGAGQRPGPGVARRQVTGRGQLPGRTPGLPDQLGGRAGRLDRRSATPGAPGRAEPGESPLDDELWEAAESPQWTDGLGERR
jgi:hypothetical protein